MLWLFVWCLVPGAETNAAFYGYRNGDGRYVFVDDVSKIPEAYRHTMQVYPERTDFLSDLDCGQPHSTGTGMDSQQGIAVIMLTVEHALQFNQINPLS